MKSQQTGERELLAADEDDDDLFDDDYDYEEDWEEDMEDEWGFDDDEPQERFSTRRKIERRSDMKRLYSQLDEFEEFGRSLY